MTALEFRTEHRAPVVRAACRESSSAKSVGLLFLTGKLATQADLIADDLAASSLETEWLIVCAVGVLSSAGEIEAESGAVVMRLPVRADIELGQRASREFGEQVAEKMRQTSDSTACVFLRGDEPGDEWVEVLRSQDQETQGKVYGGGSLPGTPIRLVSQSKVTTGGIAALVWPGRTPSRITASSACRLLSPLGEVTRADGPVIQELDHAPALQRLSEATEGLEEGSLVLLAVGAGQRPLDRSGRALALRPIVGVDPTQETLLLQEELPRGSRVAFAVRDPHGARTDFDAHLRSLKQQLAGSAPGFGLYVSCAGRGRALYGSPDVDTRLIAQHFPQMPFVGMHSTFEIAPLDRRLTPQVYAGVLGVFSLPS